MVALVLVLLSMGVSPFGDLGTWPGVLAYAWLWGVGTWATAEALRPHLAGDLRVGHVLASGGAWGGVTGVAFLLGVVAVAAVTQREPAALFLAVFGSMVAAVVGVLVGLLAGLLDAVLLRLVRRAPA